jgi:hypothetical protein
MKEFIDSGRPQCAVHTERLTSVEKTLGAMKWIGGSLLVTSMIGAGTMIMNHVMKG